jgi:hypothetical protein
MFSLSKILLGLLIFGYSFSSWALTETSLKKETSAYIIDVKYPQGFDEPQINARVQNFIEKNKAHFFKEIKSDTDIPADAPGKSGLNIIYSIPYHKNGVMSIVFDISLYHRGAAHPSNTVTVLNFIDAREVQLADLFRPGVNYLKPIANWCNKIISDKKLSDNEWVLEGTKPIKKNYETWSFSEKGINIIFDTYQVAAYVYGPQKVKISLSQVSSLLKLDIKKRVWGSN